MEKVKKKKKKKQSKFNLWFRWPLIVLFISFFLSLFFGVLSEIAMSNANIFVAIVVVLVFLFIAILTDMIGVAVAACDTTPFRAMAAKKVRGAKEAIKLVKNADRVSSIVADIMGDVCSILSGAAGTTIAVALISANMDSMVQVVISSLVSAVIAAVLISGKALMKRYSLIHCEKIILLLGKFLSIFNYAKSKKPEKAKKKTEDVVESDRNANIEDKAENDNKNIENNLENTDETTKDEELTEENKTQEGEGNKN